MDQQVVIIGGPDAGRSFRLEDGQTLKVGRGQSSDTQINDPRISRIHCYLEVDGGKVTLVDASSVGGTAVNRQPITRQALTLGDVIEIGDTKLRFQLEGADNNAPSTPKAKPPATPTPFTPLPQIAPLKNLVGQSLAHYRLDAVIASGSSGMVFKAFDTQQDRLAAVKVLTPDPSHSEEQKDRFVRAMQTFLHVKDPHIVQLYNAGKNGPYCWAAMEYVEGESMTQVIQRIGVQGMLDWRETYRVAVHVGRALAEAYLCKIIHRNVTPSSILRRNSDRCCLLGDLMLAKAMEGALARQVTQPGQIIGDVPYMSPERTRDQAAVDHRSDLYGLGATLYALLTGRPPFESPSLPDLIRKVREAEPLRPKQFQLSINDKFEDCVLKMIAKRPDDRFQTPNALLSDLERIGKFNNLEADWSEWTG